MKHSDIVRKALELKQENLSTEEREAAEREAEASVGLTPGDMATAKWYLSNSGWNNPLLLPFLIFFVVPLTITITWALLK